MRQPRWSMATRLTEPPQKAENTAGRGRSGRGLRTPRADQRAISMSADFVKGVVGRSDTENEQSGHSTPASREGSTNIGAD